MLLLLMFQCPKSLPSTSLDTERICTVDSESIFRCNCLNDNPWSVIVHRAVLPELASLWINPVVVPVPRTSNLVNDVTASGVALPINLNPPPVITAKVCRTPEAVADEYRNWLKLVPVLYCWNQPPRWLGRCTVCSACGYFKYFCRLEPVPLMSMKV